MSNNKTSKISDLVIIAIPIHYSCKLVSVPVPVPVPRILFTFSSYSRFTLSRTSKFYLNVRSEFTDVCMHYNCIPPKGQLTRGFILGV